MTRLYDVPYGRLQEFLKRLSGAGFTAEHVDELLAYPDHMAEWVAWLASNPAMTAVTSETLVQEAFMVDRGLINIFLGDARCYNLADIAEWSENELRNVRGIGDTRIQLITDVLTRAGLSLSTHNPDDANRIMGMNWKRPHAYRRDRIGNVPLGEFIEIKLPGYDPFEAAELIRDTIDELNTHDDAYLDLRYGKEARIEIRDWIAENVWPLRR